MMKMSVLKLAKQKADEIKAQGDQSPRALNESLMIKAEQLAREAGVSYCDAKQTIARYFGRMNAFQGRG